MTDYKHIDYRLRCHTKRTDLPADVLRDIGEAYEYINDLQRRIQMLRDGFEGSCTSCEPVGEMNKKLRKERDEARRLYCNTMSNVTATYVVYLRKTPEQIAKEMGWNCFDEQVKANINTTDNR